MKQAILLIGRPAYSNFRVKALLDALQTARPELKIQAIKAHEIYLLDCPYGLKPEAQAQVDSLLGATGPFNLKEGFFVTPRKGTISPWSSKATDIFHNCDLQSVDRVESGQYIQVIDADGNILNVEQLGTALQQLFDRMTEAVYTDLADFFDCPEPSPMRTVPFLQVGPSAFEQANQDWGLALSPEEIHYLVEAYTALQRDPTDAELVMFSQVNSEHCRHKIFNADWTVDGEKSERSLFSMIRNTHQCAELMATVGPTGGWSDACAPQLRACRRVREGRHLVELRQLGHLQRRLRRRGADDGLDAMPRVGGRRRVEQA